MKNLKNLKNMSKLSAILLILVIALSIPSGYAFYHILWNQEKQAEVTITSLDFELFADANLTMPLADDQIYWVFLTTDNAISRDNRLHNISDSVDIWLKYNGAEELPLNLIVESVGLTEHLSTFRAVYFPDPVGTPNTWRWIVDGVPDVLSSNIVKMHFNIAFDGDDTATSTGFGIKISTQFEEV